MTPDIWRRHFQRHFQETREASLAYDTARVCEIAFTCGELGEFTVRCEREFTPLRWAVRRDGPHHVARLLDDSGDATPPQVVRMAFETPLAEHPLDPAQAYEVPIQGGLYVARRGSCSAAVIAPPSVRGLADLRCVPRIAAQARATDSVLRVTAAARTWASARLTGDLLSASRQRDVLRAFAVHLIGLIGGEQWTQAESAASTRFDGNAILERSIAKAKTRVLQRDGRLDLEREDIGAAIAAERARLATASSDERVEWLVQLAGRFRVLPSASLLRTLPRKTPERWRSTSLSGGEEDGEWICELALRLASSPGTVEDWAGDGLRAGVACLFESPTLARAARFIVIATDRELQSRAAPGELYASWGWA
jgi:hypothetical protein